MGQVQQEVTRDDYLMQLREKCSIRIKNRKYTCGKCGGSGIKGFYMDGEKAGKPLYCKCLNKTFKGSNTVLEKKDQNKEVPEAEIELGEKHE